MALWQNDGMKEMDNGGMNTHCGKAGKTLNYAGELCVFLCKQNKNQTRYFLLCRARRVFLLLNLLYFTLI